MELNIIGSEASLSKGKLKPSNSLLTNENKPQEQIASKENRRLS